MIYVSDRSAMRFDLIRSWSSPASAVNPNRSACPPRGAHSNPGKSWTPIDMLTAHKEHVKKSGVDRPPHLGSYS